MKLRFRQKCLKCICTFHFEKTVIFLNVEYISLKNTLCLFKMFFIHLSKTCLYFSNFLKLKTPHVLSVLDRNEKHSQYIDKGDFLNSFLKYNNRE